MAAPIIQPTLLSTSELGSGELSSGELGSGDLASGNDVLTETVRSCLLKDHLTVGSCPKTDTRNVHGDGGAHIF